MGVGLAGLALVLLTAIYLMMPRQMVFGLDARPSRWRSCGARLTDERCFYVSITAGLDECRIENLGIIGRLNFACTIMLCGMLVGLCGLALAATIA